MKIKQPIGAPLCRFATSKADLLACQELRHQSFFGTGGCDADEFDPLCKHLMIERAATLCAPFVCASSGQARVSVRAIRVVSTI